MKRETAIANLLCLVCLLLSIEALGNEMRFFRFKDELGRTLEFFGTESEFIKTRAAWHQACEEVQKAFLANPNQQRSTPGTTAYKFREVTEIPGAPEKLTDPSKWKVIEKPPVTTRVRARIFSSRICRAVSKVSSVLGNIIRAAVRIVAGTSFAALGDVLLSPPALGNPDINGDAFQAIQNYAHWLGIYTNAMERFVALKCERDFLRAGRGAGTVNEGDFAKILGKHLQEIKKMRLLLRDRYDEIERVANGGSIHKDMAIEVKDLVLWATNGQIPVTNSRNFQDVSRDMAIYEDSCLRDTEGKPVTHHQIFIEPEGYVPGGP